MSDFIYVKPLCAKINNGDDLHTNVSVGSVALMCPECFHMTKVGMMSAIGVKDYQSIELFNINTECHGICPNCKEDVKFEYIDINMAQIINILNNKGFYTAYCCEGHINDEEFKFPYIYFYLWQDREIIKDCPLPKTWCITEDDANANIFCIGNYTHYVDKFENNEEYKKYLKWVKNDWNQKSVLEDIYNWANELPHKDDPSKIILRNFIDERGEDILATNANKYIDVINSK